MRPTIDVHSLLPLRLEIRACSAIFLCLSTLCLLPNNSISQGLYNNGANIVITSGATIYIDGDASGNFVNDGAGLIDIDGDIVVEGNWTNNAANNVFTARDNNGWVRFKGTGTETVGGSADTRFEYVEFNNSSGGTSISLSRNLIVEGICRFTDGVVVTGANYLIIESTTGSDVIGHSNASFVNGNLRRYIAPNIETYPFPVGDGLTTSDYYLAELVNNGLDDGAALFDYIDAKYAPLTNHNDADIVATEETTSYTSVGTEGVWFLDPDTDPDIGDYDLKLYTANYAGLSDNQFTVLSRPTGSGTAADWTCNPCGFGIGINANGGLGRMVADGYALRMGMTDFSQKGIGKTVAPLPIELVTFYADCEEEKVNISWTTASETNNHFFTVEKSINGTGFTTVSIVDGAGTSNNILYYDTYDEYVNDQTTYYRLKQTDFDGKHTYSDLVITNCGAGEEEVGFAIMPNPARDFINVVFRNTEDEQAIFSIFDLAGRIVYTNELDPESKRLLVNIGEFSPGLFNARLISGNKTYTEKLIKL